MLLRPSISVNGNVRVSLHSLKIMEDWHNKVRSQVDFNFRYIVLLIIPKNFKYVFISYVWWVDMTAIYASLPIAYVTCNKYLHWCNLTSLVIVDIVVIVAKDTCIKSIYKLFIHDKVWKKRTFIHDIQLSKPYSIVWTQNSNLIITLLCTSNIHCNLFDDFCATLRGSY